MDNRFEFCYRYRESPPARIHLHWEETVKYQATKQNQFSILSFQEEIYASNSKEFGDLIIASINAGDRELVLDFTGVKIIDSSGIGAIAKYFPVMREKGGKIILAGCNDMLKKVFHMVGFQKFFRITPTLQEVLQEKHG